MFETQVNLMSTLDYAKKYLERGFSIIPLNPKDKKPAIRSWKPYQEKLPSMDDINDWFGNGSNNNIGIVTGKISKIAVVDLDCEEALKYAKDNNFPKAPTVQTGKGYHLYYRYQEGIRNFQKRDDLPGIDLRGDGGYVVAPPSIHPSGKEYRWIKQLGIQDLTLAPLPEIILVKRPEDKTPIKKLYKGVPEGSRNDTLARLTGSWVNNKLSLEDCLENAYSWNKKNSPPLHQNEVRKTVESIYSMHHSSSDNVLIEPWSDPMPLDNYASLPEFPTDVLPDPFQEMVTEVAEANQVDTGLPGSICLAVLSTCLSKKAIVDLGTHQEPLNLYICSISGSGERKSSTINIMTAPIYEYQKNVQEEISGTIHKAINRVKIQEAKIANLQKSASKTDNAGERIKIETKLNELSKELVDNPIPNQPVLVVDDITTEALGMIMSKNDERMSILSSEGGIFSVIAGLYSDNSFNFDLYLKAHPGDPWSVHRVTREFLSMESPALTMGLTVQPEIIRELGMNRSFRGRGLLARFLFSYNTAHVGYRKRQHKQVSSELKDRYKAHLTQLLELPLTSNELLLSPEAQKYWNGFYDYVERQMQSGNLLEAFRDWGSKLPGAVARIAGLLHFAKHRDLAYSQMISKDTMDAACAIGIYYLEHALAVFGLMREDPGIESARKILEYIDKHKPESFKARDVLRNKNAFKSIDDIIPGLKVLIERSHIREQPVSITYKGGRPEAPVYEVNPILISADITDNTDKTP